MSAPRRRTTRDCQAGLIYRFAICRVELFQGVHDMRVEAFRKCLKLLGRPGVHVRTESPGLRRGAIAPARKGGVHFHSPETSASHGFHRNQLKAELLRPFG